jgi:hypothetical protein
LYRYEREFLRHKAGSEKQEKAGVGTSQALREDVSICLANLAELDLDGDGNMSAYVTTRMFELIVVIAKL